MKITKKGLYEFYDRFIFSTIMLVIMSIVCLPLIVYIIIFGTINWFKNYEKLQTKSTN